MIIEKFLNKLRKDFKEYTFNLDIQGGGWRRIFILHDGVTLGRINFKPISSNFLEHEIYGVKNYKPYSYNYTHEDKIFWIFDFYLKNGSVPEIDDLVVIAQKMRKDKNDEIRNKRREINRKRKFEGKKKKGFHRLSESWMPEFRKLVMERLK
jgi:hypothetical protein